MPKPSKGPRLGSGPSHEKLLLGTLAEQLFQHGKITTTEKRAKRLRPIRMQGWREKTSVCEDWAVQKNRGRRREVRAKRIDFEADDRKSVRIYLDPKVTRLDGLKLPDAWTSVSPTPSVFTLNRG